MIDNREIERDVGAENGVRTPVRGDTRVKILHTVASIALWAYALHLLIGNPLVIFALAGEPRQVGLGDFGSFYESGRAATQGQDPYAVYPLTLDAARGRGTGAAPNLNAPLSVPLLATLASIDPHTGRYVWFIGSWLAYAASAVLAVRATPLAAQRVVLPVLFCLAGFYETLVLGQVYAFLALVSTAAWLLLEKRPLSAGALIGFVSAIKPNFVLWPVLLFAAGQRRPALAAFASTVFFGALPVAFYGPQIYRQWLAALADESPNAGAANASLVGAASRLGAPPVVALVLAGALILILVAWAWRKRPSPSQTSSAALVGLLLSSPLAWVGYSVFLLPALVRSAAAPVLAVVAGALLMLPLVHLEDWSASSAIAAATLGSGYTVAWLLLLANEFLGDRSRPAR